MDYPYYSGNFYIQKRFYSNKKISPYFRLGYGVSGIDRGIFGGEGLKFSQYFSESLEPGIGFNIALTKSFGIQISSSFVKTNDPLTTAIDPSLASLSVQPVVPLLKEELVTNSMLESAYLPLPVIVFPVASCSALSESWHASTTVFGTNVNSFVGGVNVVPLG